MREQTPLSFCLGEGSSWRRDTVGERGVSLTPFPECFMSLSFCCCHSHRGMKIVSLIVVAVAVEGISGVERYAPLTERDLLNKKDGQGQENRAQ